MAEQRLKIASWNVCDGISGGKHDDPHDMRAVVDRVVSFDADIVMLPEAFKEEARTESGQPAELLAEASDRLLREGYDVHRILYGDPDGRKDRHGFALLTRRYDEADTVSVIELGTRRSLQQYVGELSLMVTGVHLDDRHEETRQNQAMALFDQLSDGNSVVLGDFNAMHAADPWSRRLRAVRPVVPRIQRPLVVDTLKERLQYKASLVARLTDMAHGGTMELFENASYCDVDEAHQPTKGPVQLDHIMKNFHEESGLSVGEYRLEESTKAESDHRPLSALIRY